MAQAAERHKLTHARPENFMKPELKADNSQRPTGVAVQRVVRRIRSTLWLDVEVSPGSDISEACQDAIALAEQLGITIWFEFNGVKCGARPGDDWKRLAEVWNGCLQSDSPHKVACANPPNDPSSPTAGGGSGGAQKGQTK